MAISRKLLQRIAEREALEKERRKAQRTLARVSATKRADTPGIFVADCLERGLVDAFLHGEDIRIVTLHTEDDRRGFYRSHGWAYPEDNGHGTVPATKPASA